MIGDADCVMCSSRSGSPSSRSGVVEGVGERDINDINGVGSLVFGSTRWRVIDDIEAGFWSWARVRSVGSSRDTKSRVNQIFALRSHAKSRPAAVGVSPMRQDVESETLA